MATKTKNQKRWDQNFEKCLPDIKTCYWKIFKENNVQMRRLFFKQPLIQFLWTKYIQESKGEIQSYLDSMKEEEEKYQAIINDIQDLSDTVGYQIYSF